MAHGLTLLYLTLIYFAYARALAPSEADVAGAKADILKVISANQIVGRDGVELPFLGGFVRLAFHDCVGPGHCDGCVNHALGDNAGLKRYTDALDVAFAAKSYGRVMSRADFYALASMVALERATDFVPDKFTALRDGRFLVGRKDCSASPGEDDVAQFPEAKFNIDSTLNYFSREFGFTAQEVVALLGAHTLGRASVTNSGYEGKWVRGQANGAAQSDILDNQFYLQLRGDWVQVKIQASGKFQWQRPLTLPNTGLENKNQPNMFLNSDMSLLWDLSPVGQDGNVTCKLNCIDNVCCPRALTSTATRTYINSNSLWLQDFTNVFLKMINMNDAALTKPSKASVADNPNWIDNAIRSLDELNDYIESIVNEVE